MYTLQHAQQPAATSSPEKPGQQQPEAARSSQKHPEAARSGKEQPAEVTEGGLYTAMHSNAKGNSSARAMRHITLEYNAVRHITSYNTTQ